MRGLSLLAACLILAASLAGCAASISEKNFSLSSNQVGFDKGGIASFNLTYDPRAMPADATYTLDRKYAVEHVKFDREGSIMKEHETDDARSLDLRFYLDGEEVETFVFDGDRRTIEVRLKVPEGLATGNYRLRLTLFQVGAVESNVFRVADP